MPKETIYGQLWPDGEDGNRASVVELRWDRDTGYFQIVTKAVDRYTGEDAQPPIATEELTYMSGFYVDLDRRGINALIRTLRRARDTAFGKDE